MLKISKIRVKKDGKWRVKKIEKDDQKNRNEMKIRDT